MSLDHQSLGLGLLLSSVVVAVSGLATLFGSGDGYFAVWTSAILLSVLGGTQVAISHRRGPAPRDPESSRILPVDP